MVQAGEIIIVDEFTGRLMSGRRWSDGLHQAVEAKAVSYTHLRAHETVLDLVCRLLLEKKKKQQNNKAKSNIDI